MVPALTEAVKVAGLVLVSNTSNDGEYARRPPHAFDML